MSAVTIEAPPARLSWRDLITAEPKLLAVERLVRAVGPEWRDWELVKRAFRPLVGWDARHPLLRSSESYEIAYRHLLRLWECRQ